MKPALLVIDVQKQFFKINEETSQSLKDAMEYIQAATKMFREKKLPVVYIQHQDKANGLVPGYEGFDLPAEFDVQPEDIRITKIYGNSFNGTGLKEKLTELGVDTVILTGFCAEYCVLSTARGAEDVDLNPLVLRGSLASGSKENIRFVENVNDLISWGALRVLLKTL